MQKTNMQEVDNVDTLKAVVSDDEDYTIQMEKEINEKVQSLGKSVDDLQE